MTIECKTYTLAEFRKIAQISCNDWKRHKQEVIDWYSKYFDFNITGNDRATRVTITKIYDDFEPYPGYRDKNSMEDFYRQKTDEILSKAPRNSGSNIGRIITATDNKYKHKATTAAVHVRPILKNDYTQLGAEWCKFNKDTNEYIEITAEQKEFLRKLLSSEKEGADIIEYQIDLIHNYKTRRISAEELANQLEEYNTTSVVGALAEFESKYGFRPIRVFEYRKNFHASE